MEDLNKIQEFFSKPLEEISTDSGSVSKDDAKGWDMKKTEAL